MEDYGIKYFARAKDFSGFTYTANLKKLNYTGSTTEIKTYVNPPLLVQWRGGRDEANAPIKATEAQFNFYSLEEDNNKYDEIFTEDYKTWQLEILRSDIRSGYPILLSSGGTVSFTKIYQRYSGHTYLFETPTWRTRFYDAANNYQQDLTSSGQNYNVVFWSSGTTVTGFARKTSEGTYTNSGSVTFKKNGVTQTVTSFTSGNAVGDITYAFTSLLPNDYLEVLIYDSGVSPTTTITPTTTISPTTTEAPPPACEPPCFINGLGECVCP